jgi:hypothetical protein
MSPSQSRSRMRERGQVAVLFGLMLPMILALGGIVIGIGNWYVHAKNLQTKADSGAFAGGSSWSFPCVGTATDTAIANAARLYAGPTATTPVGANPQVGKVPGSSVHAVLNGTDWFDDDSANPADWMSPVGSVCDAKILDVKMTEDNSFPLASLIPLFPDIKRKARVQIEEQNGSSGLLPIAVRVPKPVSAAAIYVDETPGLTFGNVVATHYFNDVCDPPNFTGCIASIPSGLDQWTTASGAGGNWADVTSMPADVGVVVALSFRPACPGAAPCFNIDKTTYPTVDALCNQGSGAGLAQCFYTSSSSGNQVFESGLQFIHAYSPATPGDNAPELQSVWLDTPTGTNCYQGYFSAPVANSCFARLNANVDVGPPLAAGDIEVRYKMVSGSTSWQQDDAPGACDTNYEPACELVGGSVAVEFDPRYARHAFAIRVRLQNVPNPASWGLPAACANAYSANCAWWFTGTTRSNSVPPPNATIFANPVQRSFMGNIDRSGPVKFLHLYNVDCASGATIAGAVVTGQAASVQTGRRCFTVEMGMQGALAREQDEVPMQLNIGATSQSAIVDCDPNITNLKDEIAQGCQSPTYKKHDFATTPYCPSVSGANQFFSLPKPAPWAAWPPFTCVLTQTSATPNQVIDGFEERFFNDTSNPSCPADNAQFVRGRDYWHDLNNDFTGDPDGTGPEPSQADYYTFARSSRNHPSHLRNDDPRFVLLFITPYNSFTGQGNQTFPISLIGGFYITGFGTINGSGSFTNEDPCADGASSGVPGAGNAPPPDLDTSTAGAVAWGHFVVPVGLGGSSGGTGTLCQPGTPTACVAVLVE